MAITLYNLFEAALLCVNAIAVLHEKRFLEKINWGREQVSQGFEPGAKSQIINLIHSVRTVMRRGTCESRCLESGASTDPSYVGHHTRTQGAPALVGAWGWHPPPPLPPHPLEAGANPASRRCRNLARFSKYRSNESRIIAILAESPSGRAQPSRLDAWPRCGWEKAKRTLPCFGEVTALLHDVVQVCRTKGYWVLLC
ncbi:hypothetical protein HPB47_011793 [Ixodes persulcatus]|uniref:Uncharacterized protein n=1 Tax=Ixodes persulcatus TaxID=34615 RepID=A0AC60NVD1_IXOPE|nr:hypothetical protein HPB47_011793 [Ixodes persulcatus]